MQAYHRRKALLDILVAHGSLAVGEVARRLAVSEVTIRGDLTALERQGKLRRVHGGAVLADPAYPRPGVPGLVAPAGPHLLHLAQRAAAMVEDGESIVIVAGPGSGELARALLPRRYLKVVTNSLEVAALLAGETTNTVVMAGGVVGPVGGVLLDPATAESLARLTARRAFVPACCLSGEAGVLVESPEDAATVRVLVERAETTVVLYHGEQGTAAAPFGALPARAIGHAILAEGADLALVQALHAAGVTVSLCGSTAVTVPPPGSQACYTVAFANLCESEVFTAEVRQSIEAAVSRAGNIRLLLADNNYQGETALRNVEHFIAQCADLVIEFQIDEAYGYRLMHRLRLAHIPAIAIDIPLPGAIYFGVDNYHAGRIGGDALVEVIRERWGGALDRVIALGLPRSGPAVAARMQGQIDALREGVSLPRDAVVELDSENVYDTAYRRSLEALAGIPPGARLAVVAINDPTIRGALAALRRTGHAANAIAVSQGADRLALEELVRPGTPLVGAVAFRPETYGERLIPLALDVLAGREVPPAVYQQHWLIRPENVAQYLEQHHAQARDPREMATGTTGAWAE